MPTAAPKVEPKREVKSELEQENVEETKSEVVRKPPTSGYMLFAEKERKVIKDDPSSQGLGVVEVMKTISARWKALRQEDRDNHNAACAALKRRWKRYLQEHPEVAASERAKKQAKKGGSDELPLARVKSLAQSILAASGHKHRVSGEAVEVLRHATSLFLGRYASTAADVAASMKRKTVTRSHLAAAMLSDVCFEFLEPVFDESELRTDTERQGQSTLTSRRAQTIRHTKRSRNQAGEDPQPKRRRQTVKTEEAKTPSKKNRDKNKKKKKSQATRITAFFQQAPPSESTSPSTVSTSSTIVNEQHHCLATQGSPPAKEPEVALAGAGDVENQVDEGLDGMSFLDQFSH